MTHTLPWGNPEKLIMFIGFLSSKRSVLGKWGRIQMGSDGLAGFHLFSPVGVRLVPLQTHDLKNSGQNFSWIVRNLATLTTGKYGCRKVRVYPAECDEQIGKDPSKNGSSEYLVSKSFSEGILWDSSLPIALTLWDTPVLCTPPLPLSHQNCLTPLLG